MRRVLTTILFLVSVASADSFVFNFENLGPLPPSMTLTIPDSLGSGATMTIAWSDLLEVDNLFLLPGVPPTWGMGSLAVFGGPDPFLVTFAGLTGGTLYDVQWDIGDFTPSDTDQFNVTTLHGMSIGTNNVGLLDGSLPPFNTRTLMLVDMAGITGLIFGQTGGQSLYYDNFVLNTALVAPSTDVPMNGFGGSGAEGTNGDDGRLPVPEPAAVLLLCVGFAAVALRRLL